MFNANAAEASLGQVVEKKSDVPVPFTLVTTAIQTTIRDNSLYQLVADLLPCEAESKESLESSLLADYRVEALIDDKAWIIHLDREPENVLFSEVGFEFQGSHLRVDALFAKANTLKAKQGFSACHYTAEYKNPHTNELIIVHAYIGNNGIISYQIKKYKSDVDKRKGIGGDLLVDSILKEKIRKNAEPAVMLAEDLQKEKHGRYIKAKKASYEIETKLNATLQKILINTTQSSNRLMLKAKYGVLVNSFLAVIEIINRYNDQEVDQRGLLLQQLYALMDRSVVAVKTAESKEAESQVEPEDLLNKMQIAAIQENLSTQPKSKETLQLEEDAVRAIVLVAEIKALMKKLKPLTKQQNALNNDELILRHTLKQDVNLKLVELAYLSGIGSKNNAYLANVATELNNVPVLLETFKQAVELGELDRVIQLYPHVQHENLMAIFNDLIFKRLVPSGGMELDKIIAIAEFFFEHSNCYREFIRVFDRVLTPGVGCHYSLLFRAFMYNNYLAFELMLNQGFNPNGAGLICEEVTASIINSVTYFMSTATSKFTDIRYIKILLSFGALVDNKTPNVASNIAEATHSAGVQKQTKKLFNKHQVQMRFAAQSTKSQLENEASDPLIKKILSFDSALKMLCFRNSLPKFELLELLAPESGLLSLVASIVSLVNVHNVNTRLIVGTEKPYFILCSNVMEADESRATLLASLGDKKHVTCIVYHTNPKIAGVWSKNLDILLTTLSEKYNKILEQDPVKIDTLDKFLVNQAKITDDLLDKTNLLTAALYLQLFNPQFSCENAEKIVQRLCHLGQAYFYHRFFDPASKARSESKFNSAFLCCTTLQCSKALQAIPLFDFIKKKLILLGALPEGFQLEGTQIATAHLSEIPDSQQPVGNPFTLAAQNHARQTPRLTTLGNAEIESAPAAVTTATVVLGEENADKNKKKKKK